MSPTDHAQVWHEALRKAGQLDPQAIASAIQATADTGLRAARYDSDGGGRTSNAECHDESCDDGPQPHSHPITSDPTGNAATRGRHKDPGADDLLRLDRAARDFITAANGVLWWVSGDTATSWEGVLRLNAKLLPGTVQAGLDVDDERRLPRIINKVDHSVTTIGVIAKAHLPHAPSTDEQHWTSGLADEDCCSWHLELHRRYRRPRAGGTNVCPDCLQIAELLGQKPPRWLIEAEVDLRESRPLAWRAALSRCMDELGVVRDRSA